MRNMRLRCGPRARRAIAVFAALTAMALAAMAGNAACRPAGSPTAKATSSPTPPPAPFTLAITPAAGTTNLPVSSEVGIAASGGQVTEVSLTKAGSPDKIPGTMREDGTSWIPAAPLAFSSNYTVTVTGRATAGAQTVSRHTSFSTMGKPARETETGLYMFDGETVGVAMPVALEFDQPVPEAARAEVQKRLFVTTNPPQPGVWHWASGKQAWYRAPNYWKPGTTITVRAALAGQPMGDGYFGDQDRAATVTVGPKVLLDIDNATKQMKVYADDKLANTVPVSLGKASTPSSSGHLVVMSKAQSTVFDTTNEGPGGYRVNVNWAMRLTWGGEFIHAAPWSVGDQGARNVSHGCVNMSDRNAQWLFGAAHVGDPVIVKGTEVALTNGNGWTAWNQPWSEYIKSSALPVPPALASIATTPESVSAIAQPAPAAPTASASGATASSPPGSHDATQPHDATPAATPAAVSTP